MRISSSLFISFHFSQSSWLPTLIGSSVNNPRVFDLASLCFFSFVMSPPGLILAGSHRKHGRGFWVKSLAKEGVGEAL